MKEDLLHFLWRTHRWWNTKLITVDNHSLIIDYPGDYNENQGPDFHYARIQLDGVHWFGNIEIHINSSDWDEHGHQNDPNYRNVILHVVWNHDKEITHNGLWVPTFELKNHFQQSELLRYNDLMTNSSLIPCEHLIKTVNSSLIYSQLENSAVQRLQNKIKKFKIELSENNKDWEEVFYRKFCKYLVTPTNALAMELLTSKLPWSLLQKIRSNRIDLEAMLFGLAGFLDSKPIDEYQNNLQIRFEFLKNKYNLEPMSKFQWYFLRLRPAHFPTLRIAQIASFFYFNETPFSKIIECSNSGQVIQLLESRPDDYWGGHYNFGLSFTKETGNYLGRSTKEILIINVIIPLLYNYGTLMSNNKYSDLAVSWLQSLNAEKNSKVKMWQGLGIPIRNAFHSQGSLEQYYNYCLKKQCLHCKIGHSILNHSSSF